MSRRRTSLVLISILAVSLAVMLAESGGAAAPPAFTAEPLYDIEPTGAPWFFPVCPIPIPECPPGQGAYVRQMTTFGDRAVFTAFNFDLGEEVWVTDGTPQGTHPLIDLCPGACWSLPRILGTAGGKLLFSASASGPNGDHRLWATDGVEVHPVGVEAIYPEVVAPEAIDGWLYFGIGFFIWRSDGEGLELVWAFPEGGFHAVEHIFGLGPRAFVTRDGLFGETHDLWEVHPTRQEVLRCCDANDGIRGVAILGDAAYFGAGCVAGLPDLGPGLFRTDGNPGGTVRIKTFDQGSPGHLLVAAGELFFLESSLDAGGNVVSRIWRSDGTAAGTVPLTGSLPWVSLLLVLHDRYLLFNTDGIKALDLTTGAIADLPIPSFQVLPGTQVGPGEATAAFLRDRAAFSGDDGVHGEDIWVLGLPTALAIPALGWPGVGLLSLLLAGAALYSLRRRPDGGRAKSSNTLI
jgi:ELWxxDGT repeat protein